METDDKNQQENREALMSRIFFAVFFTLIATVVTVTFCKYFILRDYYITAEANCDPESEKCFIWECDPEAVKEGEACAGNPEEDIWYYKIVRKNASLIPVCDPNQEECAALDCGSGEDCQETFCDEAVPEDGTECNDPEEYLKEMEAEEEGGEEANEECDDESEDCLQDEEDSGDTTEEDGEEESLIGEENQDGIDLEDTENESLRSDDNLEISQTRYL